VAILATAKRLRPPSTEEGFGRVRVARMTTDGSFQLHDPAAGAETWPAGRRFGSRGCGDPAMGSPGGIDARPLRRADSLMERIVVVDGRSVRYLAAGSSPAVVLLHGLGEGPSDWVAVLARLARSRAVYAPALPGFDGHRGAAEASAEGHARFLGRFLDAVGLRRVVLVGHSVGAWRRCCSPWRRPGG
jgi:predicted alpha/beta-fold hydrolase